MRGAKLLWFLVVLMIVAAVFVGVLVVQPMHSEVSRLRNDLAQAVEANGKLQQQVESLETARRQLEEAGAKLSSKVEEKEKEIEAIKGAQEELEQKFKKEIKKGHVAIKSAKGQLVVDLMDKILFESGEAELNESGREVLRKVGTTLRKLKRNVIQVGGHTDSVPISPKLKDLFPSNWELSTTRAVNVVRFLEWKSKIPSKRLIAAGFAHTRPVASNNTAKGRRRNRRIEVMLLAAPKR